MSMLQIPHKLKVHELLFKFSWLLNLRNNIIQLVSQFKDKIDYLIYLTDGGPSKYSTTHLDQSRCNSSVAL